jgi:hypothetical protein
MLPGAQRSMTTPHAMASWEQFFSVFFLASLLGSRAVQFTGSREKRSRNHQRAFQFAGFLF